MKRLVLLLASAAVIGGCSSPRRTRSAVEMQVSTSAAPVSVQSPAPVIPAQTPTQSMVTPEAIYRPPVIRRIFLEPYVDTEGNAFGPQVKYVVDNPGGWNENALRNPAKAYIPPAMTPALTQPGSVILPVTNQKLEPQPTKSLRELYNSPDVFVTGLVEYGQESLAKEMVDKLAGGPWLLYFDDKLGWLGVQGAALRPQGS